MPTRRICCCFRAFGGRCCPTESLSALAQRGRPVCQRHSNRRCASPWLHGCCAFALLAAGFQGEDPATDISGGGLLAVECITAFAKLQTGGLRHMLDEVAQSNRA
eukprot:7388523-Prymnesium_polylepis.1